MDIYLKNNVNGRLGNQLYVLLQCFIYNMKMIPSQTCVEKKYKKFFDDMGLGDLISQYDFDQLMGMEGVRIVQNSPYPRFTFNQDFKITHLESFCSKIINSIAFQTVKNPDNIEDSVSIHIRNTDYLNNHYVFFDRKLYFQKCIDELSKTKLPSTVYVFSDDMDESIKSYDVFLKSYFKDIVYVNGNDELTDLLMMSKFKTRILINSTYSYWAGFIGTTYIPDSYLTTFVPSYFDNNDKMNNLLGIHVNPLWRLIDVSN